MQIHWDFKLSPAQYARQGREYITFPLLLKCPACKANVRLLRHGFYSRNFLATSSESRIVICRYLCRSCRVTISLLPSFLLPRFQRCRIAILEALKNFFSSGPPKLYRQMLSFYINRFRRNLPAVILGFRETGRMLKLPVDENEKAIKFVELLSDTLPGDPDSTGSQIQLDFMALSL